MPSRLAFVSALALAVPAVLVLVVVLMRPARPTLPTPSAAAPEASVAPAPTVAGTGRQSTSPPAPTVASAGQGALRPPAAQPTAPARPSGRAAPGFDGGAWINSEPLALPELMRQGKVVLVDFWTYGCYNCQNTLPYVRQWWEKYKDQGLVIVGVHTPEFDSERVLENVQEAVRREQIGWPVVQDNDYAIWRAYGNNYWPRFYLVDDRGQIIYDHIGEGAYDETDRQIAAALAAAKR
ncbi:MAG TPA: redoxin domain-containing protein [Roseiflexaceae bacterium]